MSLASKIAGWLGAIGAATEVVPKVIALFRPSKKQTPAEAETQRHSQAANAAAHRASREAGPPPPKGDSE